MTKYWLHDPLILFRNEFITDIFPSSAMSYNERLNAISRCIILVTLLGYCVTFSFHILILGILSLLGITVLAFYGDQKNSSRENFQIKLDKGNLTPFLQKEYENLNVKNPLNNVLLTDINSNPDRKAAPPSFNTKVYENINESVKRTVQSLNPTIKNTNKQLFGDLGEQFKFDQSMWHYYSNPNTKIPNDQGAYANFLYGDMPSCRGGDVLECTKDNARYIMY